MFKNMQSICITFYENNKVDFVGTIAKVKNKVI